MSDLLASLLDRALNRAPVLQRRQPTLFESLPDTAFMEGPQFTSSASLQEENNFVEREMLAPPRSESQPRSTHFQTTPSVRQETQPRDAEIRPADSRRPVNVPTAFGAERETDHREPLQARTAESSVKPIVREELSSSPPPPLENQQPEKVSVAPARMIETIIEKRVERETVAAPVSEKIVREQPEIEVVQSRKAQKSLHEADDETKQPPKVKPKALSPGNEEPTVKLPTRRIFSQPPNVSPVITAKSKTDSARAINQSTTPTIQVTIGRVEVRATPSAIARTSDARPAGPRLRLEDYLRSRGARN